MLLLLFKGIFLGFAIAAPVGPINLLCMRRSLRYGQRIGFITGLGAAVADTLYGAVAAFGLTWISDWFFAYQAYISVVGAFVFAFLGIKILRTPPMVQVAEGDVHAPSAWKAFISTMFLTLSNPTTIFSFLAAFAAVKLGTSEAGKADFIDASIATGGVFLGAVAWWLFVSWISARFRTALTPKAIQRINQIAGVLLLIFAGLVFFRGIRSFL
ncbi:MAG: LysE family translocator [Proteobacteria bacterium]|nr:MAG: LysE family translocator [Pseudomonadota bacterium]